MPRSLSRFLLRVGLGIVFLWIGIDIFRHTEAWIGFAPPEGTFGLSRTQLIKSGGIFDIAVGVSFLLGTFAKLTAFLGTLHIAAVLVFQGIDQVLIRDVGLLFACASLFFWKSKRPYKKHWRLFKRRSAPEV